MWTSVRTMTVSLSDGVSTTRKVLRVHCLEFVLCSAELGARWIHCHGAQLLEPLQARVSGHSGLGRGVETGARESKQPGHRRFGL
jgi:hypothetical protein